ncbi:hypothetical protein [Vibrio ulleungensis]|uniref:Thrombospondin n=1 Tax=Vibrio ulleungensis TaxID=2807619 RepID=A0ABS2HP15_9VIBR|nr:hypothetical protein [Vibrio ulleungensis]MBM7037928.1 hypothetical protein [Vibrio ulleungensis]
MKKNQIAIALGLSGSLVLSGCGDSGGASGDTSTQTSTYSVTAIDGYLRNAEVWLDLNKNSIKDPDEPSATSGAGGVAELDVSNVTNPQNYPVIVRAIAGQTEDEDQGLVTSDYVMSAPPGEDKVTPLSTLVNVLLEQSLDGSETPSEIEQKKQQALSSVAQQLGIDSDDVLGDFIADNQAAAAYAAENLVLSQALPEDSSELAAILEEDSDSSPFVKIVQVVNAEINKKIDQVESSNGSMDYDSVGDALDTPVGATDTDNDGVPDELDKFPNNPAEYADFDGDDTGDDADLDDDNDGVNDDVDQFPYQDDKAGDFDNDGIDLLDDQYPNDTDNDGYENNVDAFPLDPTEHSDSDGDGTGDVADLDDDNDGVNDDIDLYPNNDQLAGDFDSDGIDFLDDQYPNDTDNDGHQNDVDAFPNDPTEHADADNDGTGDVADLDDDNDGVNDVDDLFPNDDTLAGDFDNDGIDYLNDLYPNDTDNDGYENDVDAFPNDPTEHADSDNDGIGDNADETPNGEAGTGVWDDSTWDSGATFQ